MDEPIECEKVWVTQDLLTGRWLVRMDYPGGGSVTYEAEFVPRMPGE